MGLPFPAFEGEQHQFQSQLAWPVMWEQPLSPAVQEALLVELSQLEEELRVALLM